MDGEREFELAILLNAQRKPIPVDGKLGREQIKGVLQKLRQCGNEWETLLETNDGTNKKSGVAVGHTEELLPSSGRMNERTRNQEA
jgi:hypothetical protein